MSLIAQYVTNKSSLPSAGVFIKQCLDKMDDQTNIDIINKCIDNGWGDDILNLVSSDKVKNDSELQNGTMKQQEKHAISSVFINMEEQVQQVQRRFESELTQRSDGLEFLDQENLDETCQQFIEWRAKLNNRNSKDLREFSLALIGALADLKVAHNIFERI